LLFQTKRSICYFKQHFKKNKIICEWVNSFENLKLDLVPSSIGATIDSSEQNEKK